MPWKSPTPLTPLTSVALGLGLLVAIAWAWGVGWGPSVWKTLVPFMLIAIGRPSLL